MPEHKYGRPKRRKINQEAISRFLKGLGFETGIIAQDYLKEFSNLLPKSDKQNFWEELKLVLTQRYIGDLWGATKNPKRLKKLEPLGDEILENRLT